VLPLSAIFAKGFQDGIGPFWNDLTNPIAFAALKLTLGVAFMTAVINAVMGTMTAYVLVRYEFPGRGLLNGMVDMPFAIPTLVTGVMLVVLYGPQRTVGAWLESHGIQVIFATPGIVLALLLVTYPFVVRAVQPVLLELDREMEEAAASLGAGPLTTFRRVILPNLTPAILAGAALAFARAIGEFGSLVLLSGNLPKTQVASLFIFAQIESGNTTGAAAVSVTLLVIALVVLLLIGRLTYWSLRHAR